MALDFFDRRGAWRTLALEVDGHQFWVPRETLVGYSRFFEEMLYGDGGDPNINLIQLANKTADEIRQMLFCLVPTPKVKLIGDANVALMLELAREYQIEDLRSRCDAFLTTKLANSQNGADTIWEILQLASKYRLRQLMLSCIKRCAVEFSFQEIKEVLASGVLEGQVVAGLMLYVDPNEEANEVEAYVSALFHDMN